MSEEQQNAQQTERPPALEREGRRLERLRVVARLPVPTDLFVDDDEEEDDPGPQAA
jgi:hypothetical protein